MKKLNIYLTSLICVLVLSVMAVVGFYIGENYENINAWITNNPTEAQKQNDELTNRLNSTNEELKSLTKQRDAILDELAKLKANGREEDRQQIATLQESVESLNYQISEKENVITRLRSIINSTAVDITAEDLEGMTKVPDYFFFNNNTLRSLELPDSITDVGVGAFSGVMIHSLTLSNNLRTIEVNAFKSLFYVDELVLPDSLERTGSGAFDNCNFRTITIGSSVNTLSGFTNLSKLETLYVRSSVIYGKLNSNNILSYIYTPDEKVYVLKTIDDGSNEWLNNETYFTKSTEEGEYNVYTKVAYGFY